MQPLQASQTCGKVRTDGGGGDSVDMGAVGRVAGFGVRVDFGAGVGVRVGVGAGNWKMHYELELGYPHPVEVGGSQIQD